MRSLRLMLGVASLVALPVACSTFKNDSGTTDAGGPAEGSAGGDAAGADAASQDAASQGDGAAAADSGTSLDSSTGTDSGSAQDSSAVDATSTCDGSSCPIEVVADNLNQATCVLVDANNVYFGDEGSAAGTVYQCPKAGCAMPITLGPGYATGLGVDGANVYWNDFSGGTVVSCAIGGCANLPTVIAPGQTQAEGVTYDGVNLFWATQGAIMTCLPPGCGTRTTLASGQGSIVHVASEQGAAYWMTGNAGGSAESCAATGCNQVPSKLVSALGSSIVVKNGVAYFTSGNAVVSCPVGGCTTPHTIGSSSDPYGLGTDGTDIFWLDDIDEVVYRCPVFGCGGGATHFADAQLSQPGANVALDGEYAYWTVPGQVLRRHK